MKDRRKFILYPSLAHQATISKIREHLLSWLWNSKLCFGDENSYIIINHNLRFPYIFLSSSTEGAPIYCYLFCPQIIVWNTDNPEEKPHQVHVVSPQCLLPSIRLSSCPRVVPFISLQHYGIIPVSIHTGLVALSIAHRLMNISPLAYS